MKSMKFLLLFNFIFIMSSCSKADDSSVGSCNDIVCGGSADNINGRYMIYRGTINPDTCGLNELYVNAATYNYYKAKWDANPEGYACWDGLK